MQTMASPERKSIPTFRERFEHAAEIVRGVVFGDTKQAALRKAYAQREADIKFKLNPRFIGAVSRAEFAIQSKATSMGLSAGDPVVSGLLGSFQEAFIRKVSDHLTSSISSPKQVKGAVRSHVFQFERVVDSDIIPRVWSVESKQGLEPVTTRVDAETSSSRINLYDAARKVNEGVDSAASRGAFLSKAVRKAA